MDEVFGEQGTHTSNVDAINRQLLPLLERAANPGNVPLPDLVEEGVGRVVDEWDLLRPTLKNP